MGRRKSDDLLSLDRWKQGFKTPAVTMFGGLQLVAGLLAQRVRSAY